MSQPTGNILLYDYQRDKDLQSGEAILVFADGKTRRVRESSLYPKEEVSVREPVQPKRPSVIRSRASGTVQHRKATARRTPARKRTPVYKA